MGITFIGTLAGPSLIKGLLAGGLGLMLAAIGVDPQTGSLRYTFGSLYLWDRLDLIPVVVGLFAIPEIVDLAVRGTSIAGGQTGKITGVMEGVKDTFRHFWLVMRCSLIGVYFGVLPVLGANVAQWISYAHAVQGLKDKSRAGKGAIEGLLGPACANNSTRGGDLIPTIAFGIPGSGAMALLLGAMLIVGLNPGPEMLKSKLDVTFAMVWVLIIANIIVAGICFMFLNHLAALTFVRGSILIPFLMFLVFIGSFTANNDINDNITTILFGVIGYFMVKFGWPRPPLILGLTLGKIAENYLWISTAAYGAKWLLVSQRACRSSRSRFLPSLILRSKSAWAKPNTSGLQTRCRPGEVSSLWFLVSVQPSLGARDFLVSNQPTLETTPITVSTTEIRNTTIYADGYTSAIRLT